MHFSKEDYMITKDDLKHSKDRLLFTLMNSGIGDAQETKYIGDTIFKRMRTRGNLPNLMDDYTGKHSDQEFAERVLIGCGFLRDRLLSLEEFHAKPSYKTYLEIGRIKFKNLGRKGVAKNLTDWTDFLYDLFENPPEREFLSPGEIQLSTRYNPDKVSFHKTYQDTKQWKATRVIRKEDLFRELNNPR